MKIYTRIVLNMETGELLEAEAYDYHGPVALCGGGVLLEWELPVMLARTGVGWAS